ncbi:MAG: sigma-70 family RNA polymerase sigma factor, partial [Saprospiraceae bacterium]|nr:sigma-70 family RNA polymerase sigma factor [Saprospiraceae bacterium]
FITPKNQADFKRLYGRLMAYAREKLFHQYPALKSYTQDLFHEAVMDLFMQLTHGAYQERASIESYFGSIYLHKCNRALKQLRPQDEFDEVSHSPLYGVDRLPEEKRQAVLDCIELLPDGEKEVIVFHYFNQYGYEVITLRTGLKEQTIKNRGHKVCVIILHSQ